MGVVSYTCIWEYIDGCGYMLTLTFPIIDPRGLLSQSSLINNSQGSPVSPSSVSLDRLSERKREGREREKGEREREGRERERREREREGRERHTHKDVMHMEREEWREQRERDHYLNHHPWNIFFPFMSSHILIILAMYNGSSGESGHRLMTSPNIT